MNGWTNIWEILGISYTTDISEIKQAYASRAKECHPEEHPEEFHRLQKAYKMAVQIAKSRAAYEKAAKEKAEKEASDKQAAENEAAEREAAENEAVGKEAAEETVIQEEITVQEEIKSEPKSSRTDQPTEPQSEKEYIFRAWRQEQDWRKIGPGAGDFQAEDFQRDDLQAADTPESAITYDYSEIEDEERRQKEQIRAGYRKKLLYMIWNPYARNHVQMWNYFFRREKIDTLFEDPGFREDFVHLIYQERFAGWHWDLIHFFNEYLSRFQSPAHPSLELRSREWYWLLQNAGTSKELLISPFLTSEEKQNYYNISFQNKNLFTVLYMEPGKSREEQYLVWYLDYARRNEDRLKTLYRDWVTLRELRFERLDLESVENRYLYMIWNPYVRNNIDMWKCFLGMKRTRELFGDPGFRSKFARRIYLARFAGWQRGQIVFFKEFLADFEPGGKAPGGLLPEEWLLLFKHTKKNGKLLRFFFVTEREKVDFRDLRHWDMFDNMGPESGKTQEEQYLDWYWRYAEQNEDRILSLYGKWVTVRKRLFYCGKVLQALPLVAAVILAFLWETTVYRPYDSGFRRYQNLYEQFQENHENHENPLQTEFEQLLEEYESR